MRYLTFALGKGRLARQTLELFEKIGITCEEMKDKDSRKLIFTNEELKLRFATKYPNIAKDYFYNTKHQTVEIVKLNGSIELAPIVGLSEVIVDIVETGSTLRENGLEVLEEVCPLSARMIVNPVSMRMESDRIKALLMKLRAQI